MTRPSADRLGGRPSTEDKSVASRVTEPIRTEGSARSGSRGDTAGRVSTSGPAAGTGTAAEVSRQPVSRTPRAVGERSRGGGISQFLGRIGLGGTRSNRTSERTPRIPAASASGDAKANAEMRQSGDAAGAPRPGAAPITRDSGRLATGPSPRTRTGSDQRDIDVQRVPQTRQRGDELTRGARDLSGTVKVGPRTDTERPSGRRGTEGDRALHVRNETTKIDSSSTVYTDQSVHINGNNNVYINGDVNGSYPTPYGVGRYHTVIGRDRIRYGSHWLDCGGWFTLNWSRQSCGRVIGLYHTPYYGYGLSYYYPGYHRKYVFYSMGGYWPDDYRYRRYYWYGCHPYRWYGSYVFEQPAYEPVVQNVYNITYETPAPVGYNSDYYYDASTEDFSDVREKIRREAAGQADDSPQPETSADVCFEQAVRLFGDGKYEQAVFKLRVAMVLEPDDVILPFAYCQALFAAGDYDGAAAALRATLESVPEDQDEEKAAVYYPRGLYEDEKVLQGQIAALAEAVRKAPRKPDYQLLLGYQLLGSGRVDEAITPLHKSLEMGIANAPAMTLIKLLEQIKADQAAAAAAAAQEQAVETPKAVEAPGEIETPANNTATTERVVEAAKPGETPKAVEAPASEAATKEPQ